jgi:excisionase family DNA binding protein
MATLADQSFVPPEDTAELVELLRRIERVDKPCLVGPEGERIALPDPVFRALRQVVSALAEGNAILVSPHEPLLTTQEAADILGISRPTLVRLLEAGEITYEMRGSHRRVRFSELMKYAERAAREREASLHEIARTNEELGLYDESDGVVIER